MLEKFYSDINNFIKENHPSRKRISSRIMEFCKLHKLDRVPTNIEILLNAPEDDVEFLKRYLYTKPVRTLSGVAVIAIMAKPYPCPHGRCTMCPGGKDSHFGTVPNSYTGNEPATMRAMRNHYDPYLQVFNRLEQYVVIGQSPEKVDLIIMGGTFPYSPVADQEEVVYFALKAMNDFSNMFFRKGKFDVIRFREFFELPGPVGNDVRTKSIQKKLMAQKNKGKKSLEQMQKENEMANIRCIGITIETKPDYAKIEQANSMLRLGCTRVELGVQSIYDSALERVNRGHTVADSIDAVKTLKDLGFKVNFHMMLGLPDIDKRKDIDGLKKIVTDPDFQPDMLKLYPCMVMPGTQLEKEWKKWLFKPITTDEAAERIIEFKKYVPEHVRIMRVQRDIPTKLGIGVDRNNLRQIIEYRMKEKGLKCRCIRCREIKGSEIMHPKLVVREYEASGGHEYFISIETADDLVVGFCRLRIPSQSLRKEITPTSALIRELHVYGSAARIGASGTVQHKGFGKQLLEEAERIAKKNSKDKMVVISGIGVRDYYRKLGYRKEGPYMVKKI
jgi:elongator complex protein 3